MKKFLIIQPAFIGDVILATALIEKLAKFYPQVQIDFFLRKGNEIILSNNPHINRIFIWDKKHNKYRHLFRLIRQIRDTKYDSVINLQRFFSSGYLTFKSGANEKVGYAQNPFSFCYAKKKSFSVENGLHEVERNQKLIAHLTDDKPAKPRIYPSENDFAALPPINEPFVTIAPASVWFTKQFPKAQWIKFLNQYLPKAYPVFLLGSSQDKQLCEDIKKATEGRKIENLAGKLSLLQSAALMSKAKMNYVNDSAPLHLASAMDAPVTAVFLSTLPSFGFGPLSTNSKIVEVTEKLPCRPCGLHGKKACPQKHFDCAYKIDLNDFIRPI